MYETGKNAFLENKWKGLNETIHVEDPRTMPGIKQLFRDACFLPPGAGAEAQELRMRRMSTE